MDLGHNQLNRIPQVISGWSKLRSLDLSHNHISDFPHQLLLPALQSFNVSYNHIQDLPKQVAGIDNLHILNLANNHLSKIPSFLKSFPHLHILDVHSNQIMEISLSASELPTPLEHLYFYHNPICGTKAGSALQNLEKLQNHVWVHCLSPVHEHLGTTPVQFCPQHEKQLRVRKTWLDTAQNWTVFVYGCPVKHCNFSQEVSRNAQFPLSQIVESHVQSSSKKVYIQEEQTCPPHEFCYIPIQKRMVEECSKCGKRREI